LSIELVVPLLALNLEALLKFSLANKKFLQTRSNLLLMKVLYLRVLLLKKLLILNKLFTFDYDFNSARSQLLSYVRQSVMSLRVVVDVSLFRARLEVGD
jgi:hypothetical protein